MDACIPRQALFLDPHACYDNFAVEIITIDSEECFVGYTAIHLF